MEELPLGLYGTTNNNIPLDNFQISITINNFIGQNESLFANHKRLNSYIGNKYPVISTKNNYFCILKDGEKQEVDPTIFEIKFSRVGFEDFSMDKFIHELKVADVTTEFKQICETFMFGYLSEHVNDTALFSAGLSKWLEKEPCSFLLLLNNKKNGQNYYYPDGNCIQEFKEIMTNSLKEHPKHLEVLNLYCHDWTLALEKFHTPKKSTIKP